MIKHRLLFFACVDFCCQIIVQMPVIDFGDWAQTMKIIGFRKIWDYNNDSAFDYQALIVATNYKGLTLVNTNFIFQMLNCAMICIISLQVQIFDSYGYRKFIQQKDGSMDLLAKLSEVKAKSLAYVYNNFKIRKIYRIQHHREVVNATTDKLKEKIVRWRQFTRTTLDTTQAVPGTWEAEKKKQVKEPLLGRRDEENYITNAPIEDELSVKVVNPT